MHKIGIHVTGSDRTNYGMAAPRAVAITSMDDPSAFDEAPYEAVKIHRTQKFSDHKDAPGDFDRIAYSDLHEAGRYWYGKMRNNILPVVRKYPNCYFQPTNEINNKRIIPYLRGFVEAAEEDNVKIALLGDAAGSPDRLEWLEHWVPFLQEMSDRGHIYVRHVYSGLPHDKSTTSNQQLSDYLTDRNATPLPADSNAARPFWEAQQLRDKGISIPILITELGWRAGWNDLPFAWITDLIAYNELMLAHDNIIGCCVWNAGQWENAPNILSGRPLADIAAIMATNTPVFFDPDAVIAPAPPLPVEPNEPTQPAPRFSLDYISTAVLFPQDMPLLKLFDLPQWADVVQEMDAKRRSMFWSHHDAIAAVVAGLPGSKLIIYGNRKEAEQLAADYEIPFEVRPIPTKPEPIAVPVDPEPVIVPPTPEPDTSGDGQPIDNSKYKILGAPKNGQYWEMIDVSHWQGSFNYDGLPDHVIGVIAKASEGTTFMDGQLKRNYLETRKVGKIFGVYHFFHASLNPQQQAQNLQRTVMQATKGDIDFWVVDVEQRLQVDNDPLYTSRLLEFIRHASGLLRSIPIIYTSFSLWTELTTNPYWAIQFPLWAAHYSPNRENPLVPAPWSAGDWALWQFTDRNTSYIGRNLDVNRTRLSPQDWLDMIQDLKNSQVQVGTITTTPDPAPTPQPAPAPTGKKYDIWAAMINGNKPFGRPYEVRHSDGSGSSFQLQYDPFDGKHYMTKGNRDGAEYEEFWLQDGYVMRGRDTSPGAGRYYTMIENGKHGARWVPRYMAIGESFTRRATVRFYTKDGNLISDNEAMDTMTLRGYYPKLRLSTGIEIFNVLELAWSGGESYFYGEDANGETLGLVAWGRTHQDPNTPSRSEVSEIHDYGQRKNSVREQVVIREGL